MLQRQALGVDHGRKDTDICTWGVYLHSTCSEHQSSNCCVTLFEILYLFPLRDSFSLPTRLSGCSEIIAGPGIVRIIVQVFEA